MRNLGDPELLKVQPLCGTLKNLNLYVEPGNFWERNLYVEPWRTSTSKSGTCKSKLKELELLRVEPLCQTLGNLSF